ncbi:MAG: cytochrome c [Acidimicrobiales bacterium]
MVLAASTQQTIGIVVALLVVVGWALYLAANVRRAKPEVGSELELAANRKPYLDDEALEGPRLERALTWGLIALTICAVGLPLYWLAEPGRQAGAVEGFADQAVERGTKLFAPTADGGFNCAGCHGGAQALGGEVPYTLTDPVTKKLRQVQWKAPALNSVTLRMSDEQIRYVLVYGRPFSPMPAWGLEGGGPLDEQQLDNLIAYLHSISVTAEEAKAQNTGDAQEEVTRLGAEGGDQDSSMGSALFNLNCARCHTLGWSYGEPKVPGSGALGPSLYNVTNQFPAVQEHLDFVAEGGDVGEKYGVNGMITGRMPFFGQVLTPQQIEAIVGYERGLAQSLDRSAAVGTEPAPPAGQPYPDVPTDAQAPPSDQAPAPAPPGAPPAAESPAPAPAG